MTEWLTAIARDLIGPLVFFLLCGVLGGTLMMGLEGVARLTGLKVPPLCFAAMPFVGLGLAIVIVLWLNCALFIDLPFAVPLCRAIGF